jgi:predicted MFS family arabinose efflux permease
MVAMDRDKFHPLERAERSRSPIREALREVWRDPVLRITLLAFGFVATFAYNTSVQVPLLVTESLMEDDALFGYLLSVMSLGNVIGSLIVARLVVASHRFMYSAGAFLAVSMAAFSFVSSVALAFILIVPVGMGLTMFLNASNIIVQQRTSPAIRSRVLALLSVIFLGSTPIGGPITGVVGDEFGAIWANAYGAIVAAVVVVVALLALKRTTGSFNPTESVQ